MGEKFAMIWEFAVIVAEVFDELGEEKIGAFPVAKDEVWAWCGR